MLINIMKQPDDTSTLSDDVFEESETTKSCQQERQQNQINPFTGTVYSFDPFERKSPCFKYTYQHTSTPEQTHKLQKPHYQSLSFPNSLNVSTMRKIAVTTNNSTTYGTALSGGYSSYRSHAGFKKYGFGVDCSKINTFEEDWKSYKYEEVDMCSAIHVQPFDDTVNHKTILLGDSGVGKTSFLVKYNTGDFKLGSFSATVGIALTNKVVIVEGTKVKLQVWDTAGQERFKSVTHAYYRDAHALLLLYDVTSRQTFVNIRAWLGEIREYAQEDVVIILLGNKADCSNSERQVKREDGERLADEYGVPFMETSAKNGLNVDLAFSAIARQLKSRGYNYGQDGRFNVHDFVRDNTKKGSLCTQCRNM